MSDSRRRALLLDLDGTLLDTAPDMVAALNRLRAEEGLDALPFETLRPQVSHGALGLVRRGFLEDPQHDLHLERRRRRFLALYAARLSEHTQLFEGMAAVLACVEAAGLPWGIVTNKPGALTAPLLQALELSTRAACVVSGDTLGVRKPHPEPLQHAARLIGCEPERCLYVGDAERDIVAGRAAGMTTVAATFGYLAADEDARQWGPDHLIDHPLALLPLVGLTA